MIILIIKILLCILISAILAGAACYAGYFAAKKLDEYENKKGRK